MLNSNPQRKGKEVFPWLRVSQRYELVHHKSLKSEICELPGFFHQVILDNSLYFSKPQFPHVLKGGHHRTSTVGLL